MRRLDRVMIAVLMFSVFATPVFADVVPPKKVAATGAVKDRLNTLGVAPEAAKAQVATLTPAETNFFAADTDRIQVVGAQQDFFTGQSVNLWYESAVGAFALALGFGIAYFMIHNRE